jgi:hypothetical protein
MTNFMEQLYIFVVYLPRLDDLVGTRGKGGEAFPPLPREEAWCMASSWVLGLEKPAGAGFFHSLKLHHGLQFVPNAESKIKMSPTPVMPS